MDAAEMDAAGVVTTGALSAAFEGAFRPEFVGFWRVETPSYIERTAGGVLQWVRRLGEELLAKEYEASPVKRVWIAKTGGKKRLLGIPMVKDRVVQTGLWLVLMPIYEADFHPDSCGCLPKRSAQQAMEVIKKQLWARLLKSANSTVSKNVRYSVSTRKNKGVFATGG